MHDGNVNDFLDHATYEEVAVRYKGEKYFFYGIVYNKSTQNYSFVVERCHDDGSFSAVIYDRTAPTIEQCMSDFLQTPIIEGKTFWELEKDMTWIEGWEMERRRREELTSQGRPSAHTGLTVCL